MTHTAGVSSLAVAISLPPRPPERLGLPQPYGRPACSAPVRGWRAVCHHLPVTRCSRRWSLRVRSAGRSGSSGRATTSAPLRALYSRSRCSSSATARRLVLSCDEDRDLAAVLVACADLGYERRQLIGQRLDATTQPVEVRPAPADLGLALVSLPGGPAPPRLRLPRRPAPRPRSARADSWSPPRARGRRARSAASPRDGRPCASAGLRRRAMPSGGRALQAWTCVRR